MSGHYVQLSANPLRFDPVSKENSVFFDEANKQASLRYDIVFFLFHCKWQIVAVECSFKQSCTCSISLVYWPCIYLQVVVLDHDMIEKLVF